MESEDAAAVLPVHSEAMLSAENDFLKQHIKRLEAAATHHQQRFCFNQISHSEQLVTSYTSLSRSMFKTLVTYVSMCDIKYHTFKVTTMTLEDQLLLVLMKLRHKFGHTDLSVRFNKSVATVTIIFRTFVSIFAEALFKPIFGKGMPSREKIANLCQHRSGVSGTAGRHLIAQKLGSRNLIAVRVAQAPTVLKKLQTLSKS